MRDLSTMEHGEPVVVWAAENRFARGSYLGCAGRDAILIESRLGTLNVEVNSNIFHVEDAHGRLLGWVMDDAPLTTIPPELE